MGITGYMYSVMNARVINVSIQKEQALYEELFSAMMEHRVYDGCYVMQYSESEVNGQKIATFMLRDAEPTS